MAATLRDRIDAAFRAGGRSHAGALAAMDLLRQAAETTPGAMPVVVEYAHRLLRNAMDNIRATYGGSLFRFLHSPEEELRTVRDAVLQMRELVAHAGPAIMAAQDEDMWYTLSEVNDQIEDRFRDTIGHAHYEGGADLAVLQATVRSNMAAILAAMVPSADAYVEAMRSRRYSRRQITTAAKGLFNPADLTYASVPALRDWYSSASRYGPREEFVRVFDLGDPAAPSYARYDSWERREPLLRALAVTGKGAGAVAEEAKDDAEDDTRFVSALLRRGQGVYDQDDEDRVRYEYGGLAASFLGGRRAFSGKRTSDRRRAW